MKYSSHTSIRSFGDWIKLILAGLLLATLAACGSNGSDGAPGATGAPGTPADPTALNDLTTQVAQLQSSAEACATCHTGAVFSGPDHQANYDQLYQVGVIKVTSLSFAFNGVDTTTLTFSMTKDGNPYDCTQAATIGSYWAQYDATTNSFPADLSLGGTPTNAGGGVCTMTKKFTAAADIATAGTIAASDGIIQLYGVEGVLEAPGHMQKGKYPFAALRRFGPTMGVATAPYTSAANVTGCENCHTQPFLKHAYIIGKVADLTPGATSPTKDFYVCKGCHYDQRGGHDQFWQALKDAKDARAAAAADPTNTALAATAQAASDLAVAMNNGTTLTTAQQAKVDTYAYNARLMNDVHMSHAMEFPYPQSMQNCVTCHEGKLTTIFADSNFKPETCISCHTADGIQAQMQSGSWAINQGGTASDKFTHGTIIADFASYVAGTKTCTAGCHGTGGVAPTFSELHYGGYDPKIYATDGTRYSTTFVVTVGDATFDSTTNMLDLKFSATGTKGSLAASNITPTVMVGLYGYDTKDFIVQAHGNAADGKRNLEHVWGDGNPRFTDVSASGGNWEVKVDLSNWASMIADGTIKHAELAVLPQLTDSAGRILGLDAPSKTFNLVNKAYETYLGDIVNVHKTAVTIHAGTAAQYAATKGCNTCHDQLATTFHSGIRGGNIKVCRLCHVKSSGGSHLEMQSRSIDSYVHAIHTFQEFDTKNIDFSDSFASMEYNLRKETEFPRFGVGGAGTQDCESCHVNGKYGVPDQSKSLPGILSASFTNATWNRSIGSVPSYVTGPAATACGGCHRAQFINDDDAGGLIAFNQHVKTQGYLIEYATGLWDSVVETVMSVFK